VIAALRSPLRDPASCRGAALPLACATVIVILCALLGSPYAYMWSVEFSPAIRATQSAAYARLFYLPLCGIAIAAGAVADVLSQLGRSRPAWPGASIWLAFAIAWSPVAHDLANAYRRQSNEKRPLLLAAVDAMVSAALAPAKCRAFLLDVEAGEAGYLLRTSSDSVIKALAPDEAAVRHCLFQSEQASWANTVGGERVTAKSVSPLRPMTSARGPAPWIDLGGVQVVYLNLNPATDPRDFPEAVFLRQQGNRFEDVAALVRSGMLRPRFSCARSVEQCR
jgi:hypothetical protein